MTHLYCTCLHPCVSRYLGCAAVDRLHAQSRQDASTHLADDPRTCTEQPLREEREPDCCRFWLCPGPLMVQHRPSGCSRSSASPSWKKANALPTPLPCLFPEELPERAPGRGARKSESTSRKSEGRSVEERAVVAVHYLVCAFRSLFLRSSRSGESVIRRADRCSGTAPKSGRKSGRKSAPHRDASVTCC
jgi:hypothetical protein